MTADVSQLFDRIFEKSDFANHYLASLMSWSENKETIEVKRKQVQLLRDYFANRNADISGKYLPLLDDIERILDSDSKRLNFLIQPKALIVFFRLSMETSNYAWIHRPMKSFLWHARN